MELVNMLRQYDWCVMNSASYDTAEFFATYYSEKLFYKITGKYSTIKVNNTSFFLKVMHTN